MPNTRQHENATLIDPQEAAACPPTRGERHRLEGSAERRVRHYVRRPHAFITANQDGVMREGISSSSCLGATSDQGCRVDNGTLCTHSVWCKTSGEVGHARSSSAAHVGAQIAKEDGKCWGQRFKPTPDSALRPRDSVEGPAITRADGGKVSATCGTKTRWG